jgi:hypothetical protein
MRRRTCSGRRRKRERRRTRWSKTGPPSAPSPSPARRASRRQRRTLRPHQVTASPRASAIAPPLRRIRFGDTLGTPSPPGPSARRPLPSQVAGRGRTRQRSSSVEAKYGPAIAAGGPTHRFVIEIDGRAVALIQWYRLTDFPEYAREIGEAIEGTAGLDLLIGEPDAVGRGLWFPRYRRVRRDGRVHRRSDRRYSIAPPRAGTSGSVIPWGASAPSTDPPPHGYCPALNSSDRSLASDTVERMGRFRICSSDLTSEL